LLYREITVTIGIEGGSDGGWGGWQVEGVNIWTQLSSILKESPKEGKRKEKKTRDFAWMKAAAAVVMLFVSIVCICSVKAGVYGV
jgi:hypothetical protein